MERGVCTFAAKAAIVAEAGAAGMIVFNNETGSWSSTKPIIHTANNRRIGPAAQSVWLCERSVELIPDITLHIQCCIDQGQSRNATCLLTALCQGTRELACTAQ